MPRKPRPLPECRYWDRHQLAAYLSRSVDWLDDNYKKLLANGMPGKDELFGMWDAVAIREWQDRRSNIVSDQIIKDARQFEQELASGEI